MLLVILHCLYFALNSLPGAELKGTYLTSSATAGVLSSTGSPPSIKARSAEKAHCQLHDHPTSTSPCLEPCQGGVPDCPSIDHVKKSQNDWQTEQAWLLSPHPDNKERSLPSLLGREHTVAVCLDQELYQSQQRLLYP